MLIDIKEIAKMVTPIKEKQDEKKEIADKVMSLVQDASKQFSEIVDVMMGGSYAKGTWLPKNADIDVFVRFATNTPENKFREIGQRVGFEALKEHNPYTRYSEHPYVEANIQDTHINIVPCYKVDSGKWKSSADRSQFHTDLMLKKLDEKKRTEVRILKQFLKSNLLYGAEISRQGFSGYVTEVLVLNLEKFENVLEKFATIKEGDVIGNTPQKFDTVISIIDPVDENRNLAAAISNENIGRFILAARAYLKNPSIEFFEPKKHHKKLDFDQIVTVRFEYKERSPDIIWGQIKRMATSLATRLRTGGFDVIQSTAKTDEEGTAVLVFLLESLEISKNQIKDGPQIFKEKDTTKFLEKNLENAQLVWVNKEIRIRSIQSREFTRADEFLENLLKQKSSNSAIPKGLIDDFEKGFTVSTKIEKLPESIKNDITEFVNTDEKIFSAY